MFVIVLKLFPGRFSIPTIVIHINFTVMYFINNFLFLMIDREWLHNSLLVYVLACNFVTSYFSLKLSAECWLSITKIISWWNSKENTDSTHKSRPNSMRHETNAFQRFRCFFLWCLLRSENAKKKFSYKYASSTAVWYMHYAEMLGEQSCV